MIEFFEGPAGTGKTTSLMRRLTEHLADNPLQEDQIVLALTYMHGSRRRLAERLSAIDVLNGKFKCMTIDGFAESLIQKRNALLQENSISNIKPGSIPHELRRACAVELLSNDEVLEWLFRRHPIIIADEMQDVEGDMLEIMQRAANRMHLFAAADEFQALNDETSIPAVEWLRNAGQTESLEEIHRTSQQPLITAAQNVRNGEAIVGRGCFQLYSSPNHNVAAAWAAASIIKDIDDIAIITPTKPSKSSFVKDTVERLRTEPVGPGKILPKAVGPFYIHWEAGEIEMQQKLHQALNLPSRGDALIDYRNIQKNPDIPGLAEVIAHFDRKRRISGVTKFRASDIKETADLAIHRIRSYGNPTHAKIRAMTIHQAKNREFKGVIVLWPYQVSGSNYAQRKLLYNAITRAKDWATVIVQSSPQSKRMNKPPFTRDTSDDPPPEEAQMSLFG